MLQRRYFDNAATSFPKPPAVAAAVHRFMTELGASGRGVYTEAREAGRTIHRCRQRIARLVNLPTPEGVIFGYNTTDALNLAVKGTLGYLRRISGSSRRLHVVSTDMEHNSILRPLNAALARDPAVEWTKVNADPATGLVDPGDLRAAIRPGQTVLVCVNHASNVTGAQQDLAALGRVCGEFGAGSGDDGLLLLVDGAQSLGHVPVDMRAANIDLLAFPGHKGLLGPQGTGGLCIRPGVEKRLDTIREGGTGNISEVQTHPETMPEKYEAGSHNAAGIAGLSEGVAWLLERGIDRVREHEVTLMRPLLDFLASDQATGLRLIGSPDVRTRVGVFSVVHDSLTPAELAMVLEAQHGLLTRAGLHCAPLAHSAFGTAPPRGQGATRLSLGPFLTLADVEFACAALAGVCPQAFC